MRPATRNCLIASFIAACGSGWMAWNAWEDYLGTIRKGSVQPPNSNQVNTDWQPSARTQGEKRTENRAQGDVHLRDNFHLDKTELAIIQSFTHPAYQIRTYRRAKAAWNEFKNRPSTAIRSYELLKEVMASYKWRDIVDVTPEEFYRTLSLQARSAVSEMAINIPLLRPEDHYDNYKFYSRLYNAIKDSGLKENGDLHSDDIIIALNPAVDFFDAYRQKEDRWRHAEADSIQKIMSMYRSGMKAGSAEMAEFQRLFEEFDMGLVFRRNVPAKNSPDYSIWVNDMQARGLTPDEGAGIVSLIAELNRQKQEADQQENDRLRYGKPQPAPHP